jgi:hypothetical protein
MARNRMGGKRAKKMKNGKQTPSAIKNTDLPKDGDEAYLGVIKKVYSRKVMDIIYYNYKTKTLHEASGHVRGKLMKIPNWSTGDIVIIAKREFVTSIDDKQEIVDIVHKYYEYEYDNLYKTKYYDDKLSQYLNLQDDEKEKEEKEEVEILFAETNKHSSYADIYNEMDEIEADIESL